MFFLNLMFNVKEVMNDCGKVELIVCESRGEVEIVFVDSGSGMFEEIRCWVF